MKYTPEQKADAMQRIESIGVAKTAEEMKISKQTLYKWRNEGTGVPSANEAETDTSMIAAKALLENDRLLMERNEQLEAENKDLRAALLRYRTALAAVLDGALK